MEPKGEFLSTGTILKMIAVVFTLIILAIVSQIYIVCFMDHIPEETVIVKNIKHIENYCEEQ